MTPQSAEQDPDYRVVVSDFVEHEAQYGVIPHHSIVLIATGRGAHYANRTRYFGYPSTDVAADNVKDLHFPGLHPDAAQWLVNNR